MSRTDVQHGYAVAPRIGGRSAGACPESRAASCGCSRWASPADDGQRHDGLKTTAVRDGDRYIVNGQKAWIRVQHSDLMILLARTTPLPEVKKKSEGLSIFLVDLKSAIGRGMTVRPIANMSQPRDERVVPGQPQRFR